MTEEIKINRGQGPLKKGTMRNRSGSGTTETDHDLFLVGFFFSEHPDAVPAGLASDSASGVHATEFPVQLGWPVIGVFPELFSVHLYI